MIIRLCHAGSGHRFRGMDELEAENTLVATQRREGEGGDAALRIIIEWPSMKEAMALMRSVEGKDDLTR